jgi:hypothetical protein
MASAVAEESMANWLRVNRQRHTELARANLNFSMRTLKPIIVSWRLTHECAVCPAQLLRGLASLVVSTRHACFQDEFFFEALKGRGLDGRGKSEHRGGKGAPSTRSSSATAEQPVKGKKGELLPKPKLKPMPEAFRFLLSGPFPLFRLPISPLRSRDVTLDWGPEPPFSSVMLRFGKAGKKNFFAGGRCRAPGPSEDGRLPGCLWF